MIWLTAIIGACGAAILLWHMQRPRPPRIPISFARFVPALPQAPARRSRIVLARPRDLLPLVCLLVAVACAIWALIDDQRAYLATRPDHLGLRIVLDQSDSMSVADGDRSRFDSARARVEAARAQVAGAGVPGACIEIVGVGARPGAVLPLAPGAALPATVAASLAEGAEPARLIEAAALPAGDCALTHVLVVTDAPPAAAFAGADDGGPMLLWDQVGAPVDNAGIRQLALTPSTFGQLQPEIRIDGIHTGQSPPATLQLDGPSGLQTVALWPAPDVEGRWSGTAAYAGPGEYVAIVADGGGYAGDDRVVAQLALPMGIAVDWRLADMPRPAALAGDADQPGAVLVTALAALQQGDLDRPVIITFAGHDAAPDDRRIGAFREDVALLTPLNFDALEAALPRAFPGPLPDGFAPVVTDSDGGVLIARRAVPPGVILPAPLPQAAEPQRSLSLTLFFAALADLVALPPQYQDLTWTTAQGLTVPAAWRESVTARPLGQPPDLAQLSVAGPAATEVPRWPWAILVAVLAILAERLLRLWRRTEAVQ